MGGWVYIMASAPYGTLYIGVTSNISRRVFEHREGFGSGFVAKYAVRRLVYRESFEDIGHAIRREKRLKKWQRAWKLKLIEAENPRWDDLYDTILTWGPLS
ncbi:MAG: excinuclease subunit, N-terminal [Phenylobacterium sp.]|nr:excinuclease subunit, N-terminal [Phenylobacterium sp.]